MSWEWLVPCIAGAAVFLLGIGAVIWGKREERNYYNGLITTRTDLREFVSRWPPRPEPGALKIGGRIAIVVGIALAAVGAVLWWLNFR